MKLKVILVAFLLVIAGCAGLSADQAVNIDTVHEAVVDVTPWAVRGLYSEIEKQGAIASDASRSQTDRDNAALQVVKLQGLVFEATLLPDVTKPIRDWAVAEVGSDKFDKVKADRKAKADAGAAGVSNGGTNGSH